MTKCQDKTLKNGQRSTFIYPSGDQYRGEWFNDLKHGNGCMIYKNGDRYFGGWIDDLRQGVGAFYENVKGEQRLLYTGKWKQDHPSGHGIFYDANGYHYEGQWKNGKRNGMGKLVLGDDDVPLYEGEWMNDLREGCGTERLPNGNVFVGHFRQDLKHGRGSYFLMKKQKRQPEL